MDETALSLKCQFNVFLIVVINFVPEGVKYLRVKTGKSDNSKKCLNWRTPCSETFTNQNRIELLLFFVLVYFQLKGLFWI